VTDELSLAARAASELEPAAREFAAAVSRSGPGGEISAFLSDVIRYRRAPYTARLLMRTAEKIRASGLPPRAVDDRLLRTVLEDGAFEDDEAMQDRWASLLANAATEQPRRPMSRSPRSSARSSRTRPGCSTQL